MLEAIAENWITISATLLPSNPQRRKFWFQSTFSSCPVTALKIENIILGNRSKNSFNFSQQKYVILALYVPRKDDVDFFEKVFSDNLTQETDLVTYIADWNLNQFLGTTQKKQGGNRSHGWF